MSKILVEATPGQVQSLNSIALKSSLDQLCSLVSQIDHQGAGGLGLDEVVVSIKISTLGEVIITNAADAAMTLKFKRSPATPTEALINFQKLENLLTHAHWQEANQETWNLLCAALQKKSQTLLTAADIEQIPVNALENIDKLWQKYSNGKFGFAIQSRIYAESQSQN